ncbi:MAG: glycosyltransferase family 1 protein, partial [Leclercia adecarboxylata]|nr:glycosyltransferase family 1 protein [Leclercia adecarboxylata]
REAIVKLHDDAALREKLAQQGYDYLCSHFTRECMLEAMEKVFSTAAQRSRSR